jgi:cyclopropane fatty-acyl-phospholipid synthase-like methyltransferase
MSSTTSSRDATVAPPAPAREPGTLGRLAERIGQALSPVPMRIELWNGTVLRPIQDPPRATLRLTRRRRLLKLLLSPSFQLSEAYRTGELEVHADLARTLTALFRRDHRPEPPPREKPRAAAVRRARRAVRRHYDLGNEFFRLWLDERMVYTCAYFTDFSNSLDQAQTDKLEHICRKLRLKPGETLLDIGCGWGAMLIYAAKHYGVIGHGVSLSEEQTRLARERIRAEGLEDRITIDVKSYVELDGSYDKISSIGMFEAVGLANHPLYFSTIHRLLKPDGIYLHHAITKRMKHGFRRRMRKSPEYKALIKYIFPGGEVDSIGMTAGSLETHGFYVHDVENLREHYARTCKLWSERLRARFDKAIAEVGEPKARLWLLYLTGCSIGFERGTAQVFQTVATKRKRGPSVLPPTRADLYR